MEPAKKIPASPPPMKICLHARNSNYKRFQRFLALSVEVAGTSWNWCFVPSALDQFAELQVLSYNLVDEVSGRVKRGASGALTRHQVQAFDLDGLAFRLKNSPVTLESCLQLTTGLRDPSTRYHDTHSVYFPTRGEYVTADSSLLAFGHTLPMTIAELDRMRHQALRAESTSDDAYTDYVVFLANFNAAVARVRFFVEPIVRQSHKPGPTRTILSLVGTAKDQVVSHQWAGDLAYLEFLELGHL